MSENGFQDLTTRVHDFLGTHRTEIADVGGAASNVFEALCFVIFARHYECMGYRLEPKNLIDNKFRFRYSTNGLPWRYSYFAVYDKDSEYDSEKPLFEIWHNQKVAGWWVGDKDVENALFAVDIAVARGGALPKLRFKEPKGDHQYWISRSDLITIGEAKKLAAYPMLLAQFLGIVHEIKPEFIGKRQSEVAPELMEHPPPTLLTASFLTSGAKRVLVTFQQRELRILVIANVAVRRDEEILEEIRAQIKCTMAIGTV